ncbi:MAG: pilus assembly protein [Bacillota bacterium]|nr:pilus assembly protein [Bacillota bacterium]
MKDRRGQAVVELALIIPVLLLLVLGVVEFGRLFNAYMTVQHAAREGARLGILGATDNEIMNRVLQNTVTLDPAQVVIGIAPAAGSRPSGSILTVSVSYNFRVLMPLLSSVVGSTIPITATLSMRVE